MRLFLLLCLLLLSPEAAAFRRQRSREMKKRAQELPAAAKAAPSGGDFTFNLYRALASAAPSQNLFFSPLSVTTSLAMLSLGTGSSTKTQILEGLGLKPQEDQEEQLHRGFQQLLRELGQPRDGFQLSLGSALFTEPTVHIGDAFLSALKTLYLAEVLPTDFKDPAGAKKQINDYVSKQTQGKIVDLIKNLDSTEIMVMVNYIFFKAKWETSFDPKSTKEQDFHVTRKKVVRVPMMSREGEYYYLLDRNLSCKVVGVPYQGNATALFVLPSEGKMAQLEKGLSEQTLSKWLKMLTKRELELYLPKFTIKGSYQLEKVLPRLGIREVFTSHADLSGISNFSNIQVSEMVHNAVAEVDESGTKAAAATGVVFMFRSARLSPPRVAFNKPFLILIVENSKNVMFLGKVTQP
ncbi:plasma serine protease inhibitor [Microcebus murinus]|uniref:plasma serine protease inhibitor n=1 Tax=Microcebus murinus TaxID=30608 RepID=UPI003F6B92E4